MKDIINVGSYNKNIEKRHIPKKNYIFLGVEYDNYGPGKKGYCVNCNSKIVKDYKQNYKVEEKKVIYHFCSRQCRREYARKTPEQRKDDEYYRGVFVQAGLIQTNKK